MAKDSLTMRKEKCGMQAMNTSWMYAREAEYLPLLLFKRNSSPPNLLPEESQVTRRWRWLRWERR